MRIPLAARRDLVGICIFAIAGVALAARAAAHTTGGAVHDHAAATAPPAARERSAVPSGGAAATPGARVAIAGEIVPDPCMPRDAVPPDDLCARLAALPRDAATRFLRDEATGELWILLVDVAIPAEHAHWLAQHGARVRVAGRAAEHAGVHALTVERVWRAHDHDAAPHGGIVGMWGDRHLELVSRERGDVRVYHLDAFMEPIAVAAASGTARIRGAADATRNARLEPAPEPGCLVVAGETRRPDDKDVTVEIDVHGEHIVMTLPFVSAASDPEKHDDHGTHVHH